MNVERLHVIARAIKEELKESKLDSVLSNLVASLQSQVASPQEASYQQQVSEGRDSLAEKLTESAVNDFSPTWQQVLDEIGAKELLGTALLKRIEAIFSENQITPSIAVEKLQEISQELSSFSGSIDQLVKALADLEIGSEELEPGECEVGILVPRAFVNNELDDFARELSELDKIFKVFAEVSTGSRPDFEIRTISSSDLTIYLAAVPPVAACVAVAIERIIALYKSLLEIRKLQNELEIQGLQKENLKGIENHANGLMDTGIEELIKDLLKQFNPPNDTARKNELKIELRYSLKKIANRIDRGFNIDVRAEPIPEEENETEDSGSVVSKEDAKYIEAIEAASENLQFMKLEGKPILSLSESNDQKSTRPEKTADASAEKKRKRSPLDSTKNSE